MTRVVFIIPISPKYEEWGNKPRPPHNWNMTNGNWVGIWGGDWGDLLCKALAEYHSEYRCEVWQPDLRADKMYSVQYTLGFTHRCFPAKETSYFKRGHRISEDYSASMLDYARLTNNSETVLLIRATEFTRGTGKLLAAMNKARVIRYHFLNNQILLPVPISTLNPLKAINRWLINREKNLWLRGSKNVLTSYNNPEALDEFQRRYPELNVFLFKQGMDLDFWKPVIPKQGARRSLGIPSDLFVIVLSQRLIPDYQLDRFIEALARVKTRRDFACYITGHGLRDYEAYLTELVKKHKLECRVNFVGFVSDEEMRSYFLAADLFATVPIISAGSAGAKKCMALGTPILHVDSGSTYEFLKKHEAGEFVSARDYEGWVKKLDELIDGKQVHTVPRDIVEDYFSWKKTADEVHYAIQHSE